MSSTQEPDYYRILNVHHQADPEIIEAAYHKMREKFQGASAALRDIEAAYGVLGDPDERAAYDARRRALTRPAPPPAITPAPKPPAQVAKVPPPVPAPVPDAAAAQERHKIQARCSMTAQGFDMVAERNKGPIPRYRVIGFEPWPSRPSDAQPRNSFFDRLFKLAGLRKDGDDGHPLDKDRDSSLPADVRDEFLEFQHIDFNLRRCPICDLSSMVSKDGMHTWAMCGRCNQILCMGALNEDMMGQTIVCPWCGVTMRLGMPPTAGGRVRATSRPPMIDPTPPKPVLGAGSQKSLPGGVRKK